MQTSHGFISSTKFVFHDKVTLWQVREVICHFSHRNVVTFTHKQNTICSKTVSQGSITHEQFGNSYLQVTRQALGKNGYTCTYCKQDCEIVESLLIFWCSCFIQRNQVLFTAKKRTEMGLKHHQITINSVLPVNSPTYYSSVHSWALIRNSVVASQCIQRPKLL